MKVLLTSVFGPFGVEDEYGCRLNVMELFHNQVTREQGIFSLRMNHPSFGLYLIAENLRTPAAVLDFPSLERFVQEVKKGYDYIGISFIVANIPKAARMAKLIREISPKTKIVLGGHGTAVKDIEKLVDCDFVCRGEGVAWFRQILGEPQDQGLVHPALFSTINRRVMGVPLPGTAAVLIPGLGCVNACSFCATSHHFQKRYIGYLNSGKDVFQTMQAIENEIGTNEFFVMDENFLKHRPRAEELLSEMEKHNKYFYLGVFSSAETINAVGVEFMAKLGIDFVWIGVESKEHVFQKTKDVDLKKMIASLRSFGIQVLGSGILFFDHHSQETIQEDIDFIIDLQTDFVQFMELGPLPGTALFEELELQGRILSDVPYREWHGQDKIWFKHPHFTREQTSIYLKAAFQQDYTRQGPSLLRLSDTCLRGYRTALHHNDQRIRGLIPRLRERCLGIRPVLQVAFKMAENAKTADLASYLLQEYKKEFGEPALAAKLSSFAMSIFAHVERARLASGHMHQPPTRYTRYRLSRARVQTMKPLPAH
ncbi:MAG: cobalamin-dependent protein [Candidatus Obscuribacterales bacterium]